MHYLFNVLAVMAGLGPSVPSSVLAASPATEAPRVVVTIKPLHAVASALMDGIGEPVLLLPDNASPHAYALRPSDAAALSDADVVVAVGAGLESFLETALGSLTSDAQLIRFAEVDGLQTLPFRTEAVWSEDHDDDGHDSHERADGEHGHNEHEEHEEHGHDHESVDAHERADGEHGHNEHEEHHKHDGHGHNHGPVDAHLWLSPDNVRLLAARIAEVLSAMDPANAAAYLENARALDGDLAQLDRTLEERLRPVRKRPFIVFHDAYQYLEERYGLTARGTITVDPSRSPGARRMRQLRHILAERGAACVFSETNVPPKLVTALTVDSDVKIGQLDPLGAGIPAGPDAYATMMLRNADALVACLGNG